MLFDESNRAIGVAYLKGARLYRAAYKPNEGPGEPRTAKAAREVILAGGAYNTPQLLMLSGIGPKEQLAKHKIPVRVNLPGVGKNMQDRYEVGITNKLRQDWTILKGATFTRDDPQCKEWARWRKGVYTTNGAAFAVDQALAGRAPAARSVCIRADRQIPGYFPGYSKLIADEKNYLTWCILKAHTENHGGTVELRSTDPREPPEVNFHYFKEGTDKNGDDLASVVAGIKFVRTLTKPAIEQGIIVEEELPGKKVQTDEQIGQFVQDNAWGHHASCTCKIGPSSDPEAVLDSNFRVYGVSNLRVVDASVFPKIPGFFIVSCVYMIAEKAADAILAAAGQAKVPQCIFGQGFWCKMWNAVGRCRPLRGLRTRRACAGRQGVCRHYRRAAAGAGRHVRVSWFITEPPSENPDLKKEAQTVQQIVQVLTAKLGEAICQAAMCCATFTQRRMPA